MPLKAGEKKRVSFTLDTAQLGYYNEDMEFVVEPGRLKLSFGTSAEKSEYETEVRLVGETMNLAGKRVYTCGVQIKE